MGDALEPRLRQRIRYETNQRLFEPYLKRHDFRWLYNSNGHRASNWTAVCNAGVIGAALHLEGDPARLAEMIYKALRSLDDYLESFDRDGGSSEGTGYWAYGFGSYVMLAQLLDQRTKGQIALLEGDRLRKIAQFPLRTRLSPGFYANFSDCRPGAEIPVYLLSYLAERLDLPALRGLIAEQPPNPERYDWLVPALRELFWRPDAQAAHKPALPEKRDWFGEMMWLIARVDPANPQGLVLALKGGHNDEMHNHNDVGSFIVHVGGESLVAELGPGRYTRDYFNEKRYSYFVTQSCAHSCPLPNGQPQMQGPEYAAQLIDLNLSDEADRVCFELKACYPPAADLDSLKRQFTLDRERGLVELVDEVRFHSGPQAFETVLITLGKVEITPGSLRISGEQAQLEVAYNAELIDAQVELVEQVDLDAGRTDVRRLVFALKQPAQAASLRLVMQPIA